MTTIPNKAHRVRTLWALFDDESLLGNMIFKRLDVEIRQITNGTRILAHAHALVDGEIIDVDLLWDRVKGVLEDMIIVRTERSALDQIRLLETTRGEDGITFINRAHIIYKLVELLENVIVMFKKFPA